MGRTSSLFRFILKVHSVCSVGHVYYCQISACDLKPLLLSDAHHWISKPVQRQQSRLSILIMIHVTLSNSVKHSIIKRQDICQQNDVCEKHRTDPALPCFGAEGWGSFPSFLSFLVLFPQDRKKIWFITLTRALSLTRACKFAFSCLYLFLVFTFFLRQA